MLPYIIKLKDRFIFRLLSDFRSRLASLIDYLRDQDLFWRLVALLEKLKEGLRPVSPAVDLFSYLVRFFTQNIVTQVGHGSSFLALLLCLCYSFATLVFKKVTPILAICSFYFKYPNFLLWATFVAFMAAFVNLAKVLFFSFVTLSPAKYLFWVFFFVLLYLCI